MISSASPVVFRSQRLDEIVPRLNRRRRFQTSDRYFLRTCRVVVTRLGNNAAGPTTVKMLIWTCMEDISQTDPCQRNCHEGQFAMFEQLLKSSQLPLRNVDTYLTFPENHLARAALTRLQTNRRLSINGSITTVYGPTGVGKTHLLNWTLKNLLQQTPQLKFVSSSVQTLCELLLTTDLDGSKAEVLERFLDLDLLICDDLHWLAQNSIAQDQFMGLVENLECGDTRILITCQKPVGELRSIDQRLVSRCHGGLCVAMSNPGLDSRVLLFQHWFRELKLPILKPFVDSARILAERLPLSPRLLRDTVLDLALRQKRNPCPIDVSYLQLWLDEEKRSPRLSFDTIVSLVASEFGISTNEIRSRSRNQGLAIPRQCAMLLARELTGRPLEQIGQYFDRSHSTVSQCLSRLNEMMPTIPNLRQHVDRLRKQLRELPREDCA